MPKDGNRHQIKVYDALHARMQPIVAQRQKDNRPVFLHTFHDPDKLQYKWGNKPAFNTLCNEAIEFYCDLHIPIPTTPVDRLTTAGKLTIEHLPRDDYHHPINRDKWLIAYVEELKKILEKNKDDTPK
jgi:hypothetical protein